MNNEELFKEYSKNKKNIELRNEIAMNNIKLVPYTINLNKLYIEGIHDYQEMLQDGYIALIKAVETYDNTLGYTFSSYAISCIISLTKNRLEYNKEASLDQKLYNDDDSMTTLQDTIKDENVNIEAEVINSQLYKEVNYNINNCLDPLELKVIKSFYGIDQEPETFKKIAEDLNMDISEVKKIRKKAELKIEKTKLFRSLKSEYYISYYPKYYLDNTRSSPTNKIYSPVEEIALKKIDKDKSLLIKTVNNLKRVCK